MDSPEENLQEKKPARKLGRQDDLVEKLKAEFENIGTSPKELAKSSAAPVILNEEKSSEESLADASPKQVGRSFADAQDDKNVKPQKQGKEKPGSLSQAKPRGKK